MDLKKRITACLIPLLMCGTGFPAGSQPRYFYAAAEMQQADASENPFNKQDDKEVPYDGSRWIQPNDWNCPTVNPKDYQGGIMLYFDKIGLEPAYAPGKTQRVYVSITGADEPVSYAKFHVFYDTRLTVKPNVKGEVMNTGKAFEGFSTGSAMIAEGQLAFYAVSDDAVTLPASSLFTIDFIIPENAEQGELYPIGIAYEDDGIVADSFISSAKDHAGMLQMTYLFTKGIYNGYIRIIGEKQTTAATTEALPAEPLWGDVNCDGTVSAADAVLLCRITAEDPCDDVPLTEQMLTAADCDGDRMITVHDAVKLLASFQADSGQI